MATCTAEPHVPTAENEMVPVRAAYLELGERLFASDVGRDVRLKARDGEELAHGSVLAAVSDAFKGMLFGGMAESDSKVVRLPDTSLAEVRFWLRLLYTGQVDEADWGAAPGPLAGPVAAGAAVRASRRTPSRYEVRVLNHPFRATDGLNGFYRQAGQFRGAPRFRNEDPSKCSFMYYGQGGEWKLVLLDSSEDPEQCFAEAEADDDDSYVCWFFSQSGGSDAGPPTGTWTRERGGTTWGGPGIGGPPPRIYPAVQEVVTVSVEVAPPAPPLRLILGALRLSRKYLVEHMIGWLTACTRDRLETENFEEVLSAAIRMDCSALRMHCLRFAENSMEIRERLAAGGFAAPEVVFELRSLFPGPAPRRRRRLL